MTSAPRPSTRIPGVYHGYRIVRAFGRVHGYPARLEDDVLFHDDQFTHPAVLSASTFEELKEQIDASDVRPLLHEVVGAHRGYALLRHGGQVYAVPRSAGRLDLSVPEQRHRPDVIRCATLEECRQRIDALADLDPVEFAGWLPVYTLSGDCGRHPQFRHTSAPPSGYHFTCHVPPASRSPSFWKRTGKKLLAAAIRVGRAVRSVFGPAVAVCRPTPGVGIGTRLRVLGCLVHLLVCMLRSGARLGPVLLFLRTRHLQSQLLAARTPGVVFLTSMPYTYGQNPWIVEIEDPTTLFYPLVQNGHTAGQSLRESPYYPIVRTLLETEQCKVILTHMRSTAQMVRSLFPSETIRQKVLYAPLGVRLPEKWQRHETRGDDESIDLLFINSWCQEPTNFYVRGGLDVLEAFAILHERYPQLRLTLRTELPPLDRHYHRIIESGWVRVISRFLPAEEMADLHATSHIFLLPAARIHVVSLLQAMSYGLAVVTSDGWGIEEYVEDERNGLVVRGRYGKASWADEEAGMLREDYTTMTTPDPDIVQGIVEAVSRLVEDRSLRAHLGRTARRDVETRYSLECWNQAVQFALDRAHGRTSTIPNEQEDVQSETREVVCR